MANYGGAIADPTVFERYKIRYIDLAFQGYIGKKDLSNEELARMAQDRYRGFIIDTDDVVEKNNNIYSWY